ncbi:MAG: DivIVA domain-containing protein [Mycobacterium sp.]
MLVVEIVVAAIVVFGVAAVAMGYGGAITNFAPDWPGRHLPEGRTVRPDDITNARFSLAFRGYRMSEVDEALDRLSFEIAQRDARIEQLTGRPFDHSGEPLPWQTEQTEQTEQQGQAEPDAETPTGTGFQPDRFADAQIQPGIAPVAPEPPRMPELPQPPTVDPLAPPADRQAVSEEPIYEQTFHEHDAETLADNPFAPPRPADPGSAGPSSAGPNSAGPNSGQ